VFCKCQLGYRLSNLVYIAYVEDSGSSGDNLADKQAPFQIIAAVLIKDNQYQQIEALLSLYISDLLFTVGQGDTVEDFEFHAHELFHGTGKFKDWDKPKRFKALTDCVETAAMMKLPIVYGAVDKVKLSKTLVRSANPLDIAFRLCSHGVENWFRANENKELGIFIADDTKNDGQKRNLKRVFRDYRKRPVTPVDPNELQLDHLLDEMYFGDSKDSIGIQIVDVCTFFIARHLAGKTDSENFYRQIEPLISSAKMYPE
jgi:hypothetical protein